MAETGLADEFPASSSTSAPSTPSSSPGGCARRLLRDRAQLGHRRRGARAAAGGAHPLGRPQVGARRGRPRPTEIYDLGVPILGICYGAQLIPQQLGGEVARGGKGEYGRTTLTVTDDASSADAAGLLADQPTTQTVWMSHFDGITRLPEGFVATATSEGAAGRRVAGPQDLGVQYHPEVSHTPHGQKVIAHFLHHLAGIPPTWTMTSIIRAAGRRHPGPGGRRPGHLRVSGGVDSAAAALVHAVGAQLTCVFVDTGLLRQGEGEQVVDVPPPPAHRADPRAVGRPLLRAAGRRHRPRGQAQDRRRAVHPHLRGVGRGSRTPDSWCRAPVPRRHRVGRGDGASTIKSHHNVGGLPEDMTFELVEPLRRCSRTRCAGWARSWACRGDRVAPAVPGPGLAVRIIGEVTPAKVAMLQHADAIVPGSSGRAWKRDLAVVRGAARHPLGGGDG